MDKDGVLTNSTLTNRQRGNEATVRPATLDSKFLMNWSIHLMSNVHHLTHCKRLSTPFLQICPFTSWQPKVTFHKWLSILLKVRCCAQTQRPLVSSFEYTWPGLSMSFQKMTCWTVLISVDILLLCGLQLLVKLTWWNSSWKRQVTLDGSEWKYCLF